MVRRHFHGVFNHFKQRLRLFFTVDGPVGVKNFVAAVLRVGLRKHIKFDVVRVAAKRSEVAEQVVDFIIGQGQAQTNIGFDQRLATTGQNVDRRHRCRLSFAEQRCGLLQFSEHHFHHAIVDERCHLLLLSRSQRARGGQVISDTAF